MGGVVIASSCTRADSTTDQQAEAARADSSAAGYAVGASTTQTAAPPGPVSTSVPVTRDTHVVATAPIGTAPRDTGTHTASTHRQDSVRKPVPDSAKRPPLPIGIAHVNDFLSYDAQARIATLTLVAGYNGLNDALNYNGGARGSQGVLVPLGWTVHVSVTNRDPDLQHSAIVIRQVLPPPEEVPAPAFAGALLPQLEEGVHEGDTASFEFVAARTGSFMIACGVPGHAQGGMWLRLGVTSDIDRPAYR
jgi:hypothetical protein